VEDVIERLFSKHVLQRLLFSENANYLIICGSKLMDVLSIKDVAVVMLVTVAPAVSTQLHIPYR
jgi:hypothetical protein